jgi:threonine/homoserine/homoserine lactone efflux protein
MPDPSVLGVFVLAALALLVVPGPAVLYIVAQAVDQGRLAGVVSMLGITTGSLVHVAAAAVGLSALLVSSATAFTAVKYAGAVYLVYLGVRRLLSRSEPSAARSAGAPLRQLYARGIVVNVLNPKTALFFFAFLPQFVDVEAGNVGLQIALLGCLFAALGLLSDGTYALLAGTLGERVRGSARAGYAQRYVSGSIFVGLGVATALSGSKARVQ